ncbi:hypothetical protein ACOSOMT5_P1899 [Acidiphilium sp. MT5]
MQTAAHRLRSSRACGRGRHRSSLRATISLIHQHALQRKSSRPVRALHRSLAILQLWAVHRSSQRQSSLILSLRCRLRCQLRAVGQHQRSGPTSVMGTLERQPRSRTSTRQNQQPSHHPLHLHRHAPKLLRRAPSDIIRSFAPLPSMNQNRFSMRPIPMMMARHLICSGRVGVCLLAGAKTAMASRLASDVKCHVREDLTYTFCGASGYAIWSHMVHNFRKKCTF